ncbi:hypothetical protein HaLaN_10692 [Haematococcus lacustris]|uniref:Uncharacterized protein n=1 Tax=Haematococcus lacustris TaxID=44745 RepID=A0A699YWL3_HAELA|nr:hypothetical protein HaLaN_10692 [Haematococcus lacustris]
MQPSILAFTYHIFVLGYWGTGLHCAHPLVSRARLLRGFVRGCAGWARSSVTSSVYGGPFSVASRRQPASFTTTKKKQHWGEQQQELQDDKDGTISQEALLVQTQGSIHSFQHLEWEGSEVSREHWGYH